MWVMSKMGLSRKRRRISASSTVYLRLFDDEVAPRRIVEGVGDREDVFISAPRLVDQNHVVGGQLARLLEGLRERVRRLQRGDEALFLHGQREGIDDFPVGGGFEAHATRLLEMSEDRRDAHIVEARRHAMGVVHLAVLVLQEVSLVALRDADRSVR